MKRILVIVDMIRGAAEGKYHGQDLNCTWWRRHARVTANIRILAKKVPDIIFVIDTTFRKKEHREIIGVLSNLISNAVIVFKDQDDGSDIIRAHLERENLMDSWLVVCGMNTDACVLRTARGLHRKGLDTVVMGDACWTVYASKSSKPHNDALSRMRRTYGISVRETRSV